MKKGRHRRFEEARKLKQSGPGFLFPEANQVDDAGEVDEYEDLARKYGAFDDDELEEEETERR